MAQVLWTQRQDIGPKARLGHALAYDTVRKRVVLFGGDSLRSGRLRDTWEWDGENWTQVADIGPSPRREYGMAYDAGRQTMVFSEAAVKTDAWAIRGSGMVRSGCSVKTLGQRAVALTQWPTTIAAIERCSSAGSLKKGSALVIRGCGMA